MKNTINEGDRIIASRIAYLRDEPERYDIILFYFPDDESQIFVKRVIGLPGETVAIMDGGVYIDGSRLEDERLDHISLSGIAENPVVLQEDEYFLLGDNADSSEDSSDSYSLDSDSSSSYDLDSDSSTEE